jgi:two-component system nitrogen regulation sensor histidine kinase NtrY
MNSGALEPDLQAEKIKRRREKLLIAVTLCLVVALTSVEIALVRQGGYPITGSLLAFGLLNINAILFLLLTFLVFRHLTKLFLERRRKVFGSRLRTRLALSFITLALLPTLFMFFIAWQLISSRVDQQWSQQIDAILGQTMALSRVFSEGLTEKLRACSRLFAQELKEGGSSITAQPGALQAYVRERQKDYQLTGLEIVNPAGVRGPVIYDPQYAELAKVALPPAKPEPGQTERLVHQVVPQGLLLNYFVPWGEAAGVSPSYLVLRQLVPLSYLTQITDTERQARTLRQTQLLIRPVRVSHYLTLVVVTLLTLMSAIWLAFYMAREITTPIRQLAEGTSKVAGGDYTVQIDQGGKDEIGFLVQSFNKMTLDLQQSRAQLASTYEQLRDSHAELEASKRHMEILLRNVAAGVIGIDAAHRVTDVNDSAAQILQLQREAVLGRPAEALLPEGESHRLADILAETRRFRGTLEKPFPLNFPRQALYLMLKTTALIDDAGNYLGVVMVFEDLTELEKAQRQAAWREVARRIAHEVKNPLTPIKLAAQRLRRRYLEHFGEDGKVFDECTQIILDQTDQIKNLVNEFSHFARLPHLSLSAQDLNALVQETLLLYHTVQPNVTLEFLPEAGLPPLLLDREQIKRLLLNLVDNALASLSGSGAVTLATQAEAEREVVKLVVADNGAGIPERDKGRIFEPYFSTKRGGTGLGLAIVNSIVADHQGSIRVEDNLPQGSKFIVELPMRRG